MLIYLWFKIEKLKSVFPARRFVKGLDLNKPSTVKVNMLYMSRSFLLGFGPLGLIIENVVKVLGHGSKHRSKHRRYEVAVDVNQSGDRSRRTFTGYFKRYFHCQPLLLSIKFSSLSLLNQAQICLSFLSLPLYKLTLHGLLIMNLTCYSTLTLFQSK